MYYRRIMGLEHELAIAFVPPKEKGNPISVERLAKLVAEHLESHAHKVGCFGNNRWWTENGCCIYMDVGGHVEIATPESIRVLDVVRHSKAAELVAYDLFSPPGPEGEYMRVFKNSYARNLSNPAVHSADSVNGIDLADGRRLVSYGCHANFLVRCGKLANVGLAGLESREKLVKLAPFLITLPTLDGAGGWKDIERGEYVHSQRSLFTSVFSTSSATGRNKPIIKTQDDPLSSLPQYDRLQLVYGDANILEVALYLKFGTTMLMLALFEENMLPDFLVADASGRESFMEVYKQIMQTENPNEKLIPIVLHQKGKDPEYRIESSIEVQYRCLEAVSEYLKKTRFDSEESEAEAYAVKDMWEKALNARASNDEEWMFGRLDGPTKQIITRREIARNKDPNKTPAIIRALIDFVYHEVGPHTMQARIARACGEKRLLSDEKIVEAKHTPPPGTRAMLRGHIVKTLKERGQCDRIRRFDWVEASIGENEGSPAGYYDPRDTDLEDIKFGDPFDCDMARVDTYLQKLLGEKK